MVHVDLRGARVLITGATSGIGAAIAVRFAEAGAALHLHHRGDPAPVEVLRRSLVRADDHRLVRADATDAADVARMFGSIGRIDVLVNAVGSYPVDPIESMTPEQWRGVVASNLDAAFLCTQAAANAMGDGDGGSIVHLASLSAHRPALHQSHYNAAKAAVVALTRSAAAELGPRGIRVNSVSPGLVWRDGLGEQWPDGVERWRARAPLGGPVPAGAIADACLFLASPLAGWVTGQDLVVDGGISATPAY